VRCPRICATPTTAVARTLGHGEGYRYPHDAPSDGWTSTTGPTPWRTTSTTSPLSTATSATSPHASIAHEHRRSKNALAGLPPRFSGGGARATVRSCSAGGRHAAGTRRAPRSQAPAPRRCPCDRLGPAARRVRRGGARASRPRRPRRAVSAVSTPDRPRTTVPRPRQFGSLYGPTGATISAVRSWLGSQVSRSVRRRPTDS